MSSTLVVLTGAPCLRERSSSVLPARQTGAATVGRCACESMSRRRECPVTRTGGRLSSTLVQIPPHGRGEVLHVWRPQYREVVTGHGEVFQVGCAGLPRG